MTEPQKRLFAGRGISARGLAVTLGVVCGCFALGIGVGWGTSLVGGELAAPEPSVSPSASATPTPEAEVSIPALDPIDREVDDDDIAAGLLSLDVPAQAGGDFQIVSADAQPAGTGASVKWVRVEYENGLAIDGDALSEFVLATLNDPRGWGARGRYEFVPTSGAPDMRVVVASPVRALERCPEPHTPASVGAVSGTSATPTPTPTPSGSADARTSCADEGLMVLSAYDWAAGLDSYGEDRLGAREYLLNHGIGHLLGEEDGVCASGEALIMTDQVDLPEDCTPNPWPWPDEPLPSPTPTPAASATRDEE